MARHLPCCCDSQQCWPEYTTAVPRKQKDGTTVSGPWPTSVALYNENMAGVDHNEQLQGYYNANLKFHKYIFWFLINVAITDSYILCKHNTSLNIKNMHSFRESLTKEPIVGYFSRKRAGHPASISIRPALLPRKKFCSDHFLSHGNPQGCRCHYCSATKHQRHKAKWFCKDCQVYLCYLGKYEDCFLRYHKQLGLHKK